MVNQKLKKYLVTQQWANITMIKLANPSTAVSSTINADEKDVKNFIMFIQWLSQNK